MRALVKHHRAPSCRDVGTVQRLRVRRPDDFVSILFHPLPLLSPVFLLRLRGADMHRFESAEERNTGACRVMFDRLRDFNG